MSIKKEKFIKELKNLFPDARWELNYETPFQLLCAVMWSARTTDIQVNKTTAKFFDTFREPQDAIALWEEWIRDKIKTIWLYKSKAKNTYKTAKTLIKEHNSKVPDKLEELIKLDWVWIKTAKVVLLELYWQPYLAVDTHVHRTLNRLEFVDTKTPEQTDKKIDEVFSKKDIVNLHHLLIFFGRYMCKSQNPDCEKCPFIKNCKLQKEKHLNK